MSRLGKQPIAIPAGVTVKVEGGVVSVSGTKGTLERAVRLEDVSVKLDNGTLTLEPQETSNAKALWGTYAAHINNMIKGVTEGFVKVLEIEGVGYRAEVKGKELVLSMGYSHLVPMVIPEGIEAKVEKNTITLSGADKDVLGQFAADVRAVRKPEPYKGKGIRYRGEFIIRKQGKKAA